jgi:putative toxin-antitoxin system antitoxin component (TIGR02293 family)
MTGSTRTKGRNAEKAYEASDVFRLIERYRSGVSLLDTTTVKAQSAHELAQSIRAGLSHKVWLDLRRLGFSAAELAAVVGISEKTISRKQQARERLDVVEGDRTMRLAHLTLDAAQAFGDLDKAMRWLRKPNRVLAGERPIDMITTEPGTELVNRALGTIEYGGLA